MIHTPTLFGIKNCDTIKKARAWLEQANIPYHFHDFRQNGVDENQLNEWIAELGWQTLINKRSTTWRQLDEPSKTNMDQQLALQTMLQQPAIIKRPVLDLGSQRHVGFSADAYQVLFNS